MNVYDFDNTIYDGESVIDLFFFYMKKTPYIAKHIPKVFYAMYKYKRGRITVEQALSDYAPFIEDYFRNIDDFESDVRKFWDGHMKKIKPFYKDLQREDDVLVTASPEITMAEVCRRLGIRHVVGSLMDPETGKITRLCMRSRKVPAFLEAFPDAHIDNFYTDSQKNDQPLIDLAEHAFIVKGSKIRQIK
ncbi:MAG: haloacid dehalogenase-like hydrolase [Clostridia bacterium]|nr:haloacid dehalogenase-like hydrolase [Clostridia bacterium]MBQ9507499.1 haloacid dehalogenase-like hydrolase [Clostridia bacterium]MBR5423027.1 haloacid dehalogenase-like hydrolase [Clostridia bacterium]